MTDQQRRFLSFLCRLAADQAGRRVGDWRDVGMEAGLSTFETDTAVHELEVDGFVFTSPGGDVRLSRDGAALCPLVTDRLG